MGLEEGIKDLVGERVEVLWGEIIKGYGPSPLEFGGEKSPNIFIFAAHNWQMVAQLKLVEDMSIFEKYGVSFPPDSQYVILLNLPKLFEVTIWNLKGFSAEEVYAALIKTLDIFLTEELYHLWEWSRGELVDPAPSDPDEDVLVSSLEKIVEHYSYGAEYRALKAVVRITGGRADHLAAVEEHLRSKPKGEGDS